MPFEDVRAQRITVDQVYSLDPEITTEFDPNRDWKEGDALPRRYLRAPERSRADVTSNATWSDGWWTVELRRKMDTAQAGDKAFQEFRHPTREWRVVGC